MQVFRCMWMIIFTICPLHFFGFNISNFPLWNLWPQLDLWGKKTLVDCLALTFFKHQVQDFTRPPYDLQDDFPVTTWKPKVGPCRPSGPQGMVGLFSGHLHGLRGWKSGQALPAAGLQWRLLWGGDSAGNRGKQWMFLGFDGNYGGCIWHLMGCYGDYIVIIWEFMGYSLQLTKLVLTIASCNKLPENSSLNALKQKDLGKNLENNFRNIFSFFFSPWEGQRVSWKLWDLPWQQKTRKIRSCNFWLLC